MPEYPSIAPVDLLIDTENPRIVRPNTAQRDAARDLAEHQEKKLLVLAEHIIKHGMNPSDLPIVAPLGDDTKRFIVLEGNRRLTALKALENPEFLVDVVPKGMVTRMRQLSKLYHANPVESVRCVLLSKEEARVWIELRHTGENEGAGIVRWGSDESSRYGARSKGLELHSQALNLLEERGMLTPVERSKVPAASYKRLLETPEVRTKLGIEFKEKQLRLLGEEKDVLKALLYVADDLKNKTTKTEQIYKKADRVKYANGLPANIVVTAKYAAGSGVPPGKSKKTQKPKKGTKHQATRERDNLIPNDCVLNITDTRVSAIAKELRSLSLDTHTNAVGVLFRVFMELSVDAFMATNSIPPAADPTLKNKLQTVLTELLARQKITASQAKPVRQAFQKNSFLAPVVTVLNDYVHERAVFPAPADLRAYWNGLQPFMMGMWS